MEQKGLHTRPPFPYDIRRVLLHPHSGNVREGETWKKFQRGADNPPPPPTPAGKALTLSLTLGPGSDPCGNSPHPLTPWAFWGVRALSCLGVSGPQALIPGGREGMVLDMESQLNCVPFPLSAPIS